MTDDYVFDIFLSYRRSGPGNAREWVHNHFYPLLLDCLADQLEWTPTIFIDVEVETGTKWPARLREALRASKIIVPVWSPPYFLSSWCLAEWQSFELREQMLTDSLSCALVYPVVFSDGDYFPVDARERQARNLKMWSYPHRSFRDTTKYNELHAEMTLVAGELASMLRKAPPWNSSWPTCRPEPASLPFASLPEL